MAHVPCFLFERFSGITFLAQVLPTACARLETAILAKWACVLIKGINPQSGVPWTGAK